jgi:hypothetical protein
MEYIESITALPQSIPFQVSAIVVKPTMETRYDGSGVRGF